MTPPNSSESSDTPQPGYAIVDLDVKWSGPAVADDLVQLLMGAQMLSELVAQATGQPVHLLDVTELRHPNMSLSLKGLAEAIEALADVIRSVPDAVVNLLLVRRRFMTARTLAEADLAQAEVAKVRAQAEVASARLELEVNNALAGTITEMIQATRTIADPNRRRAAMTEIMRYKERAGEWAPPPVPGRTEVKVTKVRGVPSGILRKGP